MKLNNLISSIFVVVITSIFLPSLGHVEEREIMRLLNGTVIRVRALSANEIETENRQSLESKFPNIEEYESAQDAYDELRKSQGLPTGPVFLPQKRKKRNPNDVMKFEIPSDQAIDGCIYAGSFSFPTICFDENGDKTIFRAGKDPQAVLDAIKASQGITGEYNVIPEDYTADEEETQDQGLPLADQTATNNSAEVGKSNKMDH
jgi:hypothetical protein